MNMCECMSIMYFTFFIFHYPSSLYLNDILSSASLYMPKNGIVCPKIIYILFTCYAIFKRSYSAYINVTQSCIYYIKCIG